jgi:hypothetical protein
LEYRSRRCANCAVWIREIRPYPRCWTCGTWGAGSEGVRSCDRCHGVKVAYRSVSGRRILQSGDDGSAGGLSGPAPRAFPRVNPRAFTGAADPATTLEYPQLSQVTWRTAGETDCPTIRVRGLAHLTHDRSMFTALVCMGPPGFGGPLSKLRARCGADANAVKAGPLATMSVGRTRICVQLRDNSGAKASVRFSRP